MKWCNKRREGWHNIYQWNESFAWYPVKIHTYKTIGVVMSAEREWIWLEWFMKRDQIFWSGEYEPDTCDKCGVANE